MLHRRGGQVLHRAGESFCSMEKAKIDVWHVSKLLDAVPDFGISSCDLIIESVTARRRVRSPVVLDLKRTIRIVSRSKNSKNVRSIQILPHMVPY
jgi:hypothetical protein